MIWNREDIIWAILNKESVKTLDDGMDEEVAEKYLEKFEEDIALLSDEDLLQKFNDYYTTYKLEYIGGELC
jgi:hypothetical protein